MREKESIGDGKIGVGWRQIVIEKEGEGRSEGGKYNVGGREGREKEGGGERILWGKRGTNEREREGGRVEKMRFGKRNMGRGVLFVMKRLRNGGN